MIDVGVLERDLERVRGEVGEPTVVMDGRRVHPDRPHPRVAEAEQRLQDARAANLLEAERMSRVRAVIRR